MAEKRESTVTATVFYATGGPVGKGWFYQFEGEVPTGPYESGIEAGRAARAVIIGDPQPPGEASAVERPTAGLDRETTGHNKYAVLNMRHIEALTANGRTQVAQDIRRALSLLEKYLVIDYGEPNTPGEFFVIMLKDQFADEALLAYAGAVLRHTERGGDMGQYAQDVLALTHRAGKGSRWCKLPD